MKGGARPDSSAHLGLVVASGRWDVDPCPPPPAPALLAPTYAKADGAIQAAVGGWLPGGARLHPDQPNDFRAQVEMARHHRHWLMAPRQL